MWESGCSRDKRRSKVGKSVFAAGSLKVRGEKVGKEGVGRGVYQFFRFSLSQSGPSVCTLPISIFFLFPLFSNAGLGRRGKGRVVKGCKNGRKRNKGVNRERGLFRMEKKIAGEKRGETRGVSTAGKGN